MQFLQFADVRRYAPVMALFALSIAACGEDTTGPGTGDITVSPPSAGIAIGDSIQLTAEVIDAAGLQLPGLVTWSSSNASRATVSSSGLVKAISSGSVTITASIAGLEGTSTISIAGSGSPALRELFTAFLGGSNDDMARDVAVASNGTAIVVGSSQSGDFPGAGPVNGPSDAFVAAFSAGGQRLWSRLIGGSGYERAYAVEIAPSGKIIIAGRADAGLPALSGTFQPNFNGGGLPGDPYGAQDGFVCTLNPADGSPEWCSYFGLGSAWIVRDVAVGNDGSIYLASVQNIGETWPAGWNVNDLRSNTSNPRNSVLAKVSADGTTLIWLAQIDGTGTTPSIRVGSDGSPVMVAELAQDLRVSKLAPDGAAILYQTDVGGSDVEWMETHQLELDASGNAYVTGYTGSSDLPTTSGAYDRTFNGGAGDAFVTKLNPAGQLVASTFLGGTGTERAEGIAMDGAGSIYLTGFTTSGNFPVTLPLPARGGDEAFMTSLSSDLSQVRFSTVLGGSQDDTGRGIAVGVSGVVYAVGLTASNDWPELNTSSSFSGMEEGIVTAFGP